MTELIGKLAVVTGGTRGLGRAIAIRLKAGGASVLVTGRSTSGIPPDDCQYAAVDFTDAAATERFVDHLRTLDVAILVNNAGINKISAFEKIATDDFLRIQQVNVTAPFLLAQAVIPRMRTRRWGRIVNISSIWGKISKEQRASYSASKFALDGLTAALAAEVACDGILANCVSPGFIDTDLTRRVLGEAGIAELTARVPARRLGHPDEVAEFVAWLAGPANTFISGQNIAIDGGFTRV